MVAEVDAAFGHLCLGNNAPESALKLGVAGGAPAEAVEFDEAAIPDRTIAE